MTELSVSVIIPCFNCQSTIDQTIQSILRQSYPNFSIVCVDDASTDQTLLKLRSYADRQIQVLSMPVGSGGPATPRNWGVRHTTSDLVAFCDSDDIWHPDKLRLQVEEWQKLTIRFPNLIISSSRLMFKTYPKQHTQLQETAVQHLDSSNLSKRIDELAFLSNPIVTSSVLCKPSTAIHFPESPSLSAVEDYALWLLLKDKGYVFYSLKSPLVYYRKSHKSISSGNSRQLSRLIVMFRYIYIHRILSNSRLNSSKAVDMAAMLMAIPRLTAFIFHHTIKTLIFPTPWLH